VRTTRMTRRHLIFLLALLVTVLAGVLIFAWYRHARLYTVTVLPRLGTRVVEPRAINDRGQIVGFCQGRFYLWEAGKDWRELGRASGRGLYLNNAGQIAGTVDDPNGAQRAFLWDPADGSRLLGAPGDISSEANAINNLGQVVGVSKTPSGEEHGFIRDKPGGMCDLGLHYPWTINDRGELIVFNYGQPLLMEASDIGFAATEVPPVGKHYGNSFYCLNNNGYVFSEALNADKGRMYDFFWRRDRSIEWLFPRGDQTIYTAVALNDANQIAVSERVLYSSWLKRFMKREPRPYKQSFLWTRQRGRVFLDKYVREHRGDYLSVAGLNNNGCIVGTVNRESGSLRQAVLLEPIPERWGKRGAGKR